MVDFKSKALIGKTIQFSDNINEMEEYAESGMRARVTGMKAMSTTSLKSEDQVYVITVDYTPFEDYNRPFESSNYWGKEALGQDPRSATYSAREVGAYNPQDSIYIPGPDLWNSYFSPINDDSSILLQRYQEQDGTLSYVEWLEAIAINSINS